MRVYDTGATGVDTVLQNARSEAVGMLVGPLTREEVLSAAQLHSGNVPQLLLNSLGAQGAPRGVYQFALSPEDEARQVARLAYAAGQRRAIVLAPTGDWGTRVTAAFTEELTRAGGSVVTQSNYDPARGEYHRHDHRGAAHQRQPRAPSSRAADRRRASCSSRRGAATTST